MTPLCLLELAVLMGAGLGVGTLLGMAGALLERRKRRGRK